jgi:DNA-binding MarR family transcriptional regulator
MPPAAAADRQRPVRLEGRALALLALRMHVVISGRLGHDLFSAPAWEMLLDLYAREDHRPVSLTSLCHAASGTPRTALNTINRMVHRGLLERSPDPDDGRRIHVHLSDRAIALLDQCLSELDALVGAWRC